LAFEGKLNFTQKLLQYYIDRDDYFKG